MPERLASGTALQPPAGGGPQWAAKDRPGVRSNGYPASGMRPAASGIRCERAT
jgi:hypothetical protein